MRSALLLSMCVAFARCASAQTLLDSSPDQASMRVAPGSTVELGARLQNLSPYIVYLHGLSYTTSATFTGTVDIGVFMRQAPDSLRPGESWQGAVAEIQVPVGQASTGHRLDFYVDGGVHWLDSQVVAQLTFVLDDSNATTAVTDGSLPRTLELRAVPNPSRGTVQIELALPQAGPVDLRIFDASGRIARVLSTSWLPAGHRAFTWDGCDPSGVALPPGAYFARLRTPAGVRRIRIVHLH